MQSYWWHVIYDVKAYYLPGENATVASKYVNDSISFPLNFCISFIYHGYIVFTESQKDTHLSPKFHYRVVYPNFDTLPQLRHSRFTHYVDAVDMLRKSPFECWSNLKTNSPFTFLAKLFLICKNSYFVNDQVREHYPIACNIISGD